MFKKLTSSIQKMVYSKNQITNLAHNKIVLYFLFLLSIANLYYLVVYGKIIFAVVFILVGFLCSFFSKNMIIILFVAICITNILKCGENLCVSEGFDGDIVPEDTEDETNLLESKSSPKKKPTKEVSNANEDVLKFMKTMKSHADNFLDVQNELTDNMLKIDPLLEKASDIIDKMEKFKTNNGDIMDKLQKYETDTSLVKK